MAAKPANSVVGPWPPENNYWLRIVIQNDSEDDDMMTLTYLVLGAAHALTALCLYLRHCYGMEKLWILELVLLVLCAVAYGIIGHHYA